MLTDYARRAKLATGRSRRSSTRRMLSLAAFVAGALLLLLVPVTLLVLAFAHAHDTQLPGTLVILSAAGGMAFIVIGAALRD
jgi:hypothetical protein